jgi:hypothetical protein
MAAPDESGTGTAHAADHGKHKAHAGKHGKH